MRKKFILLGSARTGSSWLRDVIHHHPEIFMAGEVLHYRDGWNITRKNVHKRLNVFFNGTPGTAKERKDWYGRQYLDDKFINSKCIGFKVFHKHLQAWNVENYFKKHNINIIFLERNFLDSYISLQHATRTGTWTCTHKNSRVPSDYKKHALDIDFPDLLKYIHRNSKLQNSSKLRYANNKSITVKYEELLNDLDGQIVRILDFLEVDPDIKIKSNTYPSSKRAYSQQEKIKNYSTIAEELTNHGYGHLLI